MLYEPRKKITFVLYEDQKTSRAIEFKKVHIKLLLSSLVFIFIVLLCSSLYLLANIQNVKEQIAKREPILIKNLREKEITLNQEIARLEGLNEQYLEKISTTKLESDSILPLFSPTLGFKDLSNQKLLNVENIQVKKNNRQINFNFNIVNKEPDEGRISGHIFIVMKISSQIYFYPEKELQFDDALSTYNQGETFTISRFRQVNGYFKGNSFPNKDAEFKIYIFNRTGDLIHQQSVGPLKVE